MKGSKVKGYLALFVGTQKRGLLQKGYGLYFGYLEHHGVTHTFKRSSDVAQFKIVEFESLVLSKVPPVGSRMPKPLSICKNPFQGPSPR